MSSSIINKDTLYMALEENGIHVTVSNNRVTGVSVDDRNQTFSYVVSNGELKELYLKDVDVEIEYKVTDSTVFFKLIHGRTMHSAEGNL